ncbi:MAG: family 20 glycosylhydrolase [Phycisphaeraceae bacterium]|nr:family 20 glycosylhydrolase [Phycisphaeraceae bacterium]
MNKPLLLPAPRRIRWDDGHCRPDAPCSSTVDARMDAQGYRLRIRPDAIAIDHADDAGLRHAHATLAQLRRQGSVPCGEIEDVPAFAVRGLMLDISRDRVPTMDELRRLLARMAGWKMNHLQLYSEHAIAYRGHEQVTEPASAIGLDELAQLSREATALGITLVPNQNCFGHLERWFRHPRYEPLAEQPGDPGHHHRCGCRALAPAVPEAMEFIRDLVGQLCQAIDAPIFNIGGDETWDIGKGRSRHLVERHGYSEVYGRFLGRIMREVRRYDRQPAFWADILLKHPRAADQLDREAIALDWGYGPTHDFDATESKLIAAGFTDRWICPGTSCWSSWAGRSDERRANLLRAVRAGVKYGVGGMLVTCWGDGGHRQIWPASLAGIAEAAHRFWCGPEIVYDPLAGGLNAFDCPELGPWLDELGQVERPLRDGARYSSAYHALHPVAQRGPDRPWLTPVEPLASHFAASEWQSILDRMHDLMLRIPGNLQPQLHEECRHAAALITLGAERGRATCAGESLPSDWEQRLNAAIDTHRRLWLLRARPGGLEDSSNAFVQALG